MISNDSEKYLKKRKEKKIRLGLEFSKKNLVEYDFQRLRKVLKEKKRKEKFAAN